MSKQNQYLLKMLVDKPEVVDILEGMTGSAQLLSCEQYQNGLTTEHLNGSGGKKRKRMKRKFRQAKTIPEVILGIMQANKDKAFTSMALRGHLISQGYGRNSVGPGLTELKRKKLVKPMGRGIYAIPGSKAAQQTPTSQ
jgi:hypothetical protein